MTDIYTYTPDFDKNEILSKMDEISEQLVEEQNKPSDEFSSEREFNLIYRHFMQGLKLSTGVSYYR